MPFVLIVPLWILCLLLGAGLFCSPRWRGLSLYVALGPTGFTVCSFFCSTAVIVVAGKWPKLFLHSGLLAVGGYLGALLVGGAVGGVAGLAFAYKLNRRRSQSSADANSEMIR